MFFVNSLQMNLKKSSLNNELKLSKFRKINLKNTVLHSRVHEIALRKSIIIESMPFFTIFQFKSGFDCILNVRQNSFSTHIKKHKFIWL